MEYCKKCGAEIKTGSRFCPACGEEVGYRNGETASGNGMETSPGKDAEENKVMAILSYLLFFIPLLTGDYKKSPFVKYHVNQGTVLFIFAVIFGVAYAIITNIIISLFFFTGVWVFFNIINTLFGLLWLLPTVLCILGIVNAATGKKKPLPVIGKFTIIK